MSLSCTVNEILSLISQNLKRSRDSEHIHFGSNIPCMHSYSSVLISTPNVKCLSSLRYDLNLNKKLSYRRGSAPRATLVNSCHVSRAIPFDVMQACVRHVDEIDGRRTVAICRSTVLHVPVVFMCSAKKSLCIHSGC